MTIRKTSILALLVMTVVPLLATCGRGAPPPKEDFVPPTVLATTPKDGFMEFPVGDPIKIDFTEEMDPATINAQTIVLTSATGTAPYISVQYGNTTAILTPAGDLDEGTLHTVTIKGTAADKSGNLMGRDYSFSFITQVYPSVRSTVPKDNEVNVPVNRNLSITFSKQIDPLTLNVSLVSASTGSVPLNPPTTTDSRSFLIEPNIPPRNWLEPDTRYTAKVSAGVKDYKYPDPNIMQQDYIWSFTTGSAPDSTPPFVEVTDPDRGAVDVSVTPRIQVVFSEALSSSSTPTLKLVTAGTNTVLCSRVTSTDTKYFDYFLPPSVQLNYSKQYTAIVGSAGIMDTSGNPMTGDYLWTFTTVRASTTTSISVPDPVPYGNVDVTVTVASSAGTPTGSVTLSTAPSPTVSLTKPLNSSGVAIFTISNPSVGVYHALNATYGQQGIFSESEAASGFSVGAAGSTTTVASSSPTSTFGGNPPVTFTATVAPAAASGSVTFYNNGLWLGSGTLYGGTATFLTEPTVLTAGTHTITAVYNGDGNYGQSTSPAITQTVNKAATTTAVGSSSNPSEFNASVTLTATVISASTVTTGTVTFKDGLTTLGTSSLLYGSAALDRVISAGTHSITATYNGSANFAGSTSPVFIQNVNKAPTTTMINVPDNNPYSNVTVTVNIVSSFGTPTTGNVTLSTWPSPSTTLPQQSLNSSGAAVFTIPTPSVGVYHYVRATYAPLPSSIYAGSEGNGGFSVGAAGSTTTVTSSSPTSTFGNSVTFTATVTPSAATGTVRFYDSVTELGSAPLSSGKATFGTSTLAAGSHSITAEYSGDGNYAGSTSPGITQTVNPATTTTAVTSSSPTSTFGASVTFTATVTSTAPGTVTGTVTFRDGATDLGTGSLSGGTATFSTATLAVGPHSIRAVYGGSANYAASTSSAITQTVGLAPTQTFVSSDINPSTFGALVTFTAMVFPSTADGIVTFRDGATVLGTGTLADGTATFSTEALAGGPHSIRAAYGGSANFAGSTSPVFYQTVGLATTSTVVTSNPNPSTYGASVTFTSTVTPSTATGTVTFRDGATVLGTGSLAGGTAAFSTAALAGGTHSITAAYGGSANFGASTSAAITQTVNPAATTTVVTSYLNPSTFGASVIFAATVSAPTATGTVTFYDNITTVLGTGSLSGGIATFSTAALGGGSHSITATYGGNATFGASTSAAITQTVSPAATTTVVTSNPNPSAFGASVTFTATVSAPAATGTVTFYDNITTVLGTGSLSGGIATFSTAALGGGSHSITATYGGSANYGASTATAITQTVNPATTTTSVTSSNLNAPYGASVTFTATVSASTATGTVTFYDNITTVLGTGSLSGGIATFSTAALSVGVHSITATYGGSANFGASTSAAISQNISNAATTVVVTSNPNPSTYGATVTFTATVTPSAATGTVTFRDGAMGFGSANLSGGIATFSTSTLGAGNHVIRADYSGDPSYLGETSSPLGHEVIPATTTTSVTSSNLNSTYGASVTFTATVTPSTATGTVTFYDNMTTVLGTGSLSGGTATFSTTALAVGAHSITATYGVSANFTTSTSAAITQTVGPAGTTTSVTSNPNPSTYGASVTFTATVTPSTATGTVTFYDNITTVLGTGSLSGGTATFSTAALGGGSHSITATYGGSANFTTSTSAAITQTANPAGTTTVVTSNPNPSTYGASVTFTATVVSSAGTPTGSVTFYEGGIALGAGTLSGGQASVTTLSLAAGPHSITATYNGNANFAPSTSATPIIQNVNPVVTPSAGMSGAISPSTPQTVNYNTTQQFTITPDTGYHIVTPVGGTCGGSLAGTIYTTNAITANCTVAATFAINTYTVSTSNSPGSGGSIAPPAAAVNYNLTTTLAVSANSLYYIASVSGCGGTTYTNTDPTATTHDYTTGPITGDCTVTATYEVAPLAPIGATQGIGFGSLGAMSFLLNHKLFGNLFRRRRKQNGSRGTHPREDRRD